MTVSPGLSDGELVDVPSDEDINFDVTLFFTSTIEGRAHTPFSQYALLGDSPDVTGGGGHCGYVEVFLRPRLGPSGRRFQIFSTEANLTAPGDLRTRSFRGVGKSATWRGATVAAKLPGGTMQPT